MVDQQHDPADGPEIKRAPAELAQVLEGYIRRASDADQQAFGPAARTPEVLEALAEAAALLAFFGKATQRETAAGPIVLSVKQTQAAWGVYVTALVEGGRQQQMQLDAATEGQAFEEAAKMVDKGALATLIVVRSMVAYDVTRPAPVAPAGPCANGHTWSNDFGDDWKPERGAKCDCGQKGWGVDGTQ